MELVITGLLIMITSALIISVTYGFHPRYFKKSVVLPMFKGHKGVRYFMILVFSFGLIRVVTGTLALHQSGL